MGDVLSRTTTWDKAPLQDDPWFQFLLREKYDDQWQSKSTNASDCDDSSGQSAISDQSEVDSHASAIDHEEDWDQIIAWAAGPVPDYVGVWGPASLYGEMLTWNEGESVPIEVLSSKKFRMSYVGITYVAELSEDGALYWDDGDVWSRRKASTCAKDASHTSDCRRTYEDLKFDGVWGPARLKKGVLTWNEGEAVEVDVLSEVQFRITYVGRVYSAELRSDGKLHWSDGDVWSRRCTPCTTDHPAHGSLPPWLRRQSQNRQCIKLVPPSRMTSATLSRAVGQVPECRRVFQDSQTEITSRCEGDNAHSLLDEQPNTLKKASAATSCCGVAVAASSCQRGDSKKMHHRAVDQRGHVAHASLDSAPTTPSLVSNVRQARGRTVIQSAPIDKKRYAGTVSWFRGSYGWVSCTEVNKSCNVDRTFLHINDCDFNPRQGNEVEFCLALDSRGNPKAVNVKQAKAPINARDWFAERHKR